MKVTGKPEGELDIKRCYLPGVVLEGPCPKCGEPVVKDFEEDYLSYPNVNEPVEATCFCGECGHKWTVTLRLNVTLEVVKPEKKPKETPK